MPSPCFLNKDTNIPKLLCCKQPCLPPRNLGSSTLYRAWLTCEHHLFSRAKARNTAKCFLFQLVLFATQKPRLFDSVTHVHLKCVDGKRLFEAPGHTTSSNMRRACLVVRPEISTACDAQDLLHHICSHINICVKLFSLNMPQFYLFNLEHRAMQPYLISLKYPDNIRKLDPPNL